MNAQQLLAACRGKSDNEIFDVIEKALVGMSFDDAQSVNAELAEERDYLRKVRLAIGAVLDDLHAEETIKAKLAMMNDKERAAMAKFIRPDGIGSGEKVGGTGVG